MLLKREILGKVEGQLVSENVGSWADLTASATRGTATEGGWLVV